MTRVGRESKEGGNPMKNEWRKKVASANWRGGGREEEGGSEREDFPRGRSSLMPEQLVYLD